MKKVINNIDVIQGDFGGILSAYWGMSEMIKKQESTEETS